MFLKSSTFTMFFSLSLFTIAIVYLLDESVAKEIEQNSETIPAHMQESLPIDTRLPVNELNHLESSMKLNLDTTLFPNLFSQYISACKHLKQERRAIDFFRKVADGIKQPSPHILTAMGVITYGWSGEKTLRDGLEKIDDAISREREAFFPRLCRATYLAYMPERFPEAIDQFYSLIENEKHNRSHLEDIYKNLSRIYLEHGHIAMARNIEKKLHLLQDKMHKKCKPLRNPSSLSERERKCEQITHFPYSLIHNTPFVLKVSRAKDSQLDSHLSLLENYLERRHNDDIFSTLFTRYVLLAWQYQEYDRAISFFETLAKRYPNSSNVLTAVGTISFGWRGQMLLQEGLHSIEKATERKSEDLFSRIHYATIISYFPNGFQRSMHEFSLLKQEENGSTKYLDTINSRVNNIRLHHGYDIEQIVDVDKSETKQWSY